MTFETFAKTIETSQLKGQHIFVQCLPKMGSTALSLSLANAVHEYNMEEAPLLMQRKNDSDFEEVRLKWLKKRQQSLLFKVDICTSMFMLTAEISDHSLTKVGYKRMLLNRSLRPWLKSISNWSFLHSNYPRREAWENSYRNFVAQNDPELQAIMPATLNTLRNMVLFWMPVWLTYQTLLDIQSPKWISSNWSLINNTRCSIPKPANRSQFSNAFRKQFDELIPAMPQLQLSPDKNHLFQSELRRKLLDRAASAI